MKRNQGSGFKYWFYNRVHSLSTHNTFLWLVQSWCNKTATLLATSCTFVIKWDGTYHVIYQSVSASYILDLESLRCTASINPSPSFSPHRKMDLGRSETLGSQGGNCLLLSYNFFWLILIVFPLCAVEVPSKDQHPQISFKPALVGRFAELIRRPATVNIHQELQSSDLILSPPPSVSRLYQTSLIIQSVHKVK